MADETGLDPRVRDFLGAFAPPPGKRQWHGATLLGSLRGIDAGQAAWLPAGLANSIWRLALHCAYSRYVVRRPLEGQTDRRGQFPRPGAYWPRLPPVLDDAAWQADLALLKEEHQRLVGAIKAFDPCRLDEHTTQQWTYADLLWGILMHDTYHTGQIQLLKRMYREHTEP